MAQQLRVGIAGTGGRSHSFAVALRGVERAQLVAVQDPIAEARDRFAQQHGVDTTCATFDELLGHVDLAVLVTPLQHHAPQACEALAHGVHVLSEVPAAVSHEQAQALVAAVRSGDARYAIAENYCFTTPNLIVRELVRAGELGELYYGEHDHFADMKAGVRLPDGRPRWTYYWWVGRDGNTYPTHSLGPLLQWFEDRVVAVSCVGAGRHTAPEHELQDVTVLLARTVRGSLIRLGFSMTSNRPVQAHNFAVQGTRGAYDGGDPVRGVQPALYLEGRSPAGSWELLEAYADRFLPARYTRGPGPLYPAENAFGSQFAPGEAFLMRDLVDALLDDRPFELDVYAALDMTLPGLAAETSIAQGGAWVHVPNPRFFTAGIGVDAGREAPLA